MTALPSDYDSDPGRYLASTEWPPGLPTWAPARYSTSAAEPANWPVCCPACPCAACVPLRRSARAIAEARAGRTVGRGHAGPAAGTDDARLLRLRHQGARLEPTYARRSRDYPAGRR